MKHYSDLYECWINLSLLLVEILFYDSAMVEANFQTNELAKRNTMSEGSRILAVTQIFVETFNTYTYIYISKNQSCKKDAYDFPGVTHTITVDYSMVWSRVQGNEPRN